MTRIPAHITFSLAIAACATAAANPDTNYREWQLKRLLDPTAAEQLSERQDRIFIYEGLYDTDIEQAMDTQFGRVENMMFVRTVVTDDKGSPKRDDATDELITEEDDCD